MGCDIQCHVEYNRIQNKEYEDIDLYKRNRYFEEDREEFVKVDIYQGRCYFLFGILAGVRNYNVKPISEARGIPEDCCENTRKEYLQYERDYHHPSWYTLSELKDAQKEYQEDCLQEFIDSIEKRFIDVINYGWSKKLTPEEEKYIRVIFWFDN